MTIEKLDRYYIPFVGKMPDGYYVSEEAYRAREDALLNALKSVANVLDERVDTLRVEKIIREIEATR